MNKKALNKELAKTEKKERKIIYRAATAEDPFLQEKVNAKIPKKIKSKLDGAFQKAFSLIFSKGSKYIKKTYSEKKMQDQHEFDKRFAHAAGNALSIRSFQGTSRRKALIDGLMALGNGAGLGFLGRGIISIPMFVSIAFRNTYQTAACYGFPSESPKEQFLMLLMMEAALSTGEDAEEADDMVEETMELIDFQEFNIQDSFIQKEIESVSKALSDRILYLKALQVIPIFGGIIGLTDVHFFHKIHKYIDIKYRKRFLLNQV